jgi:hypothetical protein
MRSVPAFADPGRPFLGLLSTRAQAEVATFLIANGADAFSLEEIREGTGLSRASIREAVKQLVAWGQARVANPGSKRARYASDEQSPVTMALHLLTAAAADALWPSEREFPRVLAGLADAAGGESQTVFTGAFVPLAASQATTAAVMKQGAGGGIAQVLGRRTTEGGVA